MNTPRTSDTDNTTTETEQERERLAVEARLVRTLLPFLPGPSFPDDELEEEEVGG